MSVVLPLYHSHDGLNAARNRSFRLSEYSDFWFNCYILHIKLVLLSGVTYRVDALYMDFSQI